MDTDWAKIIFTDESFFWLLAAVERYGVGRFIHNVLIIPVNGCLLAQRFGQFIFYKKIIGPEIDALMPTWLSKVCLQAISQEQSRFSSSRRKGYQL